MCEKEKKRLNSTKEKVGWENPSRLQTRGGMLSIHLFFQLSKHLLHISQKERFMPDVSHVKTTPVPAVLQTEA